MIEHEVKYFYLCAKKPGFCGHDGPCQNDDCRHTQKEEQAKNHFGRKFFLFVSPYGAERWEYETEEQKAEFEEMARQIKEAIEIKRLLEEGRDD